MINPESSIEAIERFLKDGSDSALTYAALECRLAIERICYERLRIAHDYIAHEDLKKWQPRDVVNQLIQEVDPHAASTFTLEIGTKPLPDGLDPPTPEQFEGMDFVKVGTQVGFDPNVLGKLWNALSHLALHINLPKNKDDHIPQYGDPIRIRAKVEEAFSEIKRIQSGTLISSGIGEVISFACPCGSTSRRRVTLLQNGQEVNCANPECAQSYTYLAAESAFVPRMIDVVCKSCGETHLVPRKLAENLPKNHHIRVICACSQTIFVAWRLKQTQVPPSDRDV